MRVPNETQDAMCRHQTNCRFTEKYDITLSDMAKAELRGHFKEAVLAWVDIAADPTKGVEQVCRLRQSIRSKDHFS